MGHVYDRHAIESHMRHRAGDLRDPVTNLPLPSTTLTSVHLLRSRAMEYRETTARACIDRVLSGACSDPASYLRRAAELCASCKPTMQIPGMSSAVIEYITTHTSNVHSSFIVEKFAEGLRHAGLIDEATRLYLRLLELGCGDASLQTRVLKSCVACWADEHGQPDKEPLLLRLAAFIETQRTFTPSQVVDIMLEAKQSQQLALQLCEHLLAKMDLAASSASISDAAAAQQQTRVCVSLLLKYTQIRFSSIEAMQEVRRMDTDRGGMHAANESLVEPCQAGVVAAGSGDASRATVPLRRMCVLLSRRGRGAASGVFAVLSLLRDANLAVRCVKAATFVYAVHGWPRRAKA